MNCDLFLYIVDKCAFRGHNLLRVDPSMKYESGEHEDIRYCIKLVEKLIFQGEATHRGTMCVLKWIRAPGIFGDNRNIHDEKSLLVPDPCLWVHLPKQIPANTGKHVQVFNTHKALWGAERRVSRNKTPRLPGSTLKIKAS